MVLLNLEIRSQHVATNETLTTCQTSFVSTRTCSIAMFNYSLFSMVFICSTKKTYPELTRKYDAFDLEILSEHVNTETISDYSSDVICIYTHQ